MTVFKELKRRNVFKVATAYLITAWLIIQIVAVLEPHMNLPEWIVPVIIVFLVVGFPIACLFAWAFELTPEGIKRSKDVVVDDSISNLTGRKIDFGIIAAMAIAVVFLTYEAYFSESKPVAEVAVENLPQTNTNKQKVTDSHSEQVTSIAVLPFVNMSNDPEQEYFSDGLSEELLNVLARIKQLKVAARTSSFFFKNKNMDIKEIANKLDVEHVLEGSVRKSGTKLRVTAQLIQADSGYHLWSETYDYELDDVFKIQDEISAAVVKQLKVTLLNEQLTILTEHGTNNADAQDAYLKGRYFMRSRTPESLQKAVTSFKQSITFDSSNQLAISGLVDTYSLQANYANLTDKDFLALAKPLVQPYLELANNSAEMDTTIGGFYLQNVEFDKGIAFYKSAINKNPNYAQAYHWLGTFYRNRKIDFKKAEGNLLQALKLDPYSEVILISLFGTYYQQGKILEAENYLHLVNEIAPNASFNNYVAHRYYWVSGRDWQKAYDMLHKSNIEKSQLNHDTAIQFYLALNELDKAEQQIGLINKQDSYQANIVFNYQILALNKLHQGLITEQQFIAFVSDKITQYPHNDNIISEVDLLLRKNDLNAALKVMVSKYDYLLAADKLHFQELLPAAYYVYILRQLEMTPNSGLEKILLAKLDVLEDYSKVPEIATFYRVMLYTLLGKNDIALQQLHTLYVDSNYYNNVVLLQQWIIFENLRALPEFQNIITVANQKLLDKRLDFLGEQNNQAIYNTQ